jgi:tRNA pseudouridine13 synthase
MPMVQLPSGDPTLELPHAHGGPAGQGLLRAIPDDFVVDEDLGYQPSGQGEHAFLVIRKRNTNTHDLARSLAKLCGIAQVGVGYAGLKDRQAVTTQSFSVHLPGRPDPDWTVLDDEDIQVLSVARHHRKIRRGSLRGNRFRVRLREVNADREALEQRLQRIARHGVPNYFGSQRFGHAGSNLRRADALLRGELRKVKREQKGILLSAARAQLFNQVLAARVDAGNWDRVLRGDVLLLAGSERQFIADSVDDTLLRRAAEFDIHPSGPLPGRPCRTLVPEEEAAWLESQALRPWLDWIDGLARLGLDADRRSLRLKVDELAWHWESDQLLLDFALPAGSYATVVVRELLHTAPAIG